MAKVTNGNAIAALGVAEFPHAVHDFYKPRSGGDPTQIVDWAPSMARQEFAEECDINAIMARYQTTGQLPANFGAQPRYLDLTGVPETLQETLAQLKDAEDAFMRLPATVRREFDNDAVAFTEFALNPDNFDTLREWGLAKPKPVEAAPAAPGAPVPAPVGDPGLAAAAPGAPSPAK